MSRRALSDVANAINDLNDVGYFLLDTTGGWVLCPQRLECWGSESLWFGWFGIMCFLCAMCFFLLCFVDTKSSTGGEGTPCVGRGGERAKLVIFYLFLFGAAGAVQVLGLGYDIQLVLLFDVGIVLSLVFIGGVLRMAYPELYQKQKNK